MKKIFLHILTISALLCAPTSASYAQNWLNDDTHKIMNHDFDEQSNKETAPSNDNRDNVKQRRKMGKEDTRNKDDKQKSESKRGSAIANLLKSDSQITAKMEELKEKDHRLAQSVQREIRTQMKQFNMLMQDKNSLQETKTKLKSLVNKELDSILLSISYNLEPNEAKKNQIRQKLEEAFIIKEQLHQKHIQIVKERTAKLEEMLSQRKSHKEKIIDMRLSQLTKSEDTSYQW